MDRFLGRDIEEWLMLDNMMDSRRISPSEVVKIVEVFYKERAEQFKSVERAMFGYTYFDEWNW